MAQPKAIELEQVSTHNLKAISVSLPTGALTVVTGASGSGKSSLVFDTLYAEAYRRYLESLSSYARQYLTALPKPVLGAARHLPAAIAVRQGVGATSSGRSTVGTATELQGLLRVVFTHLATIICSGCGRPVQRDHEEIVARRLSREAAEKRVLIVGPLAGLAKVPAKELKPQLEAQGFTRLRTADGRLLKIAEAKAADLKGAAVVVDRLTVREGGEGRLREALALAFKVGRGRAEVMVEETGAGGSSVGQTLIFSTGLDCPGCGLTYEPPSPALLNFSHPLGACPTCQGFGAMPVLDLDRIIPDRNLTLADEGVACWNFGRFAEYFDWARESARRRGLSLSKPFKDFSEEDWQWLRMGEGKRFDGIEGFFRYLDSKKYKPHYRIHGARFRRYATCDTCQGRRLSAKALACRIGGQNLADVAALTVDQLIPWTEQLRTVAPSAPDGVGEGGEGVAEALAEAQARLTYLSRVGLGYLSLDRTSRTLSGGELQRLHMATCLGSALTATLYCLDEPSAGLHARDGARLLDVLRDLRDQGNTVVVVEHERQLIAGADHLIEIGPGAGHEGGQVVFAGPPAARPRPAAFMDSRSPDSGGFARQLAQGRVPFLTLEGASIHNLKDVSVRIPVGAVTAVCGVSGSGKTSLIQHSLYPLLCRALGQGEGGSEVAGRVGPPAVLAAVDEALLVHQSGIGRSSRSTIATYLGLMDHIRKLFASEPQARQRGLEAASFSFNSPAPRRKAKGSRTSPAATLGLGGGRCETCKGLGTVDEDLSFLGTMAVICPACNGRRFDDTVLAVTYRGKNLTDVLGMTVAEGRAFFFDQPALTRVLDLVVGMGLGYLTLSQQTSRFSGGEAQRLKLLGLLRDVKSGSAPKVLILDEPTTGLSDADVARLQVQIRQLATAGHTVIVVEHHLDVIGAADWLIEIGPDAGAAGGRLIYQGPPAGLRGQPESRTAPFLS